MHIKHQLQRRGHLKGMSLHYTFSLGRGERKGVHHCCHALFTHLTKASPRTSQPHAFKGVVTALDSLTLPLRGRQHLTRPQRATPWNPL